MPTLSHTSTKTTDILCMLATAAITDVVFTTHTICKVEALTIIASLSMAL